MAIYLITAFVFVSLFLILFAALYLLSKRKDPVQIRLKELRGRREGEVAEGKTALSLKGAVDILGIGSEQAKGTKLWLAQAGYRRPTSVSNYYGARLLGAMFLGILGLLLGLFFHLKPLQVFATSLIGILVGGFIPKIWVARKIIRRREEIRHSVANVLDLMVVCVEAGLSLNAAIQKIAEETAHSHKSLSQELNLMNQEILIGKTRAEAFRNLARRTGVEELRSLAVMLIQTDKLGTSIGSSLRVLADSLRVKRRQRAEEAAHKTSIKLVFPLVLLIFPELLVILLGPAVITLVKVLGEMGK
jgi:tight adherence protein C